MLLLLAVMAILSCGATSVRADGGAPNLAYVAGGGQGVSVIDVGQQAVTKNIKATGNPAMVQLSQNGQFLYVTQPAENRVSIMNARTGQTVCSATIAGTPDLLAIDLATSKLFAAGSGGPNVSEIDTTNCAIKRTFATNGPVHGLAIAAVGASLSGKQGNQLWVASGDSLTVFDDLTGDQLSSTIVKGKPGYILIPPGATVYTVTQEGSIIGLDLNTREQLTVMPRGGQYGPMDYDANTGEIYVPDLERNALAVLTPITAGPLPKKQPNRFIDLDAKPASVAITSDGQLGFAALENGTVAMLDIPGRQLIKTINVGGIPRFIITGLYPPLIGDTPQQSNILNTIATIGAYVLVAALLIVPIILYRRYATASKASSTKTGGKKRRKKR